MLHLLHAGPVGPGPAVVGGKGSAGAGIEAARPGRAIRSSGPPAPASPRMPRARPGCRQRIKAVIGAVKNELGNATPGAPPKGLWARTCQRTRIAAMNTAIRHYWLTGGPVKRPLIDCGH